MTSSDSVVDGAGGVFPLHLEHLAGQRVVLLLVRGGGRIAGLREKLLLAGKMFACV